MKKIMIHPKAEIKTLISNVGNGTNIWQFVVVLDGAKIGSDCNINAHCLIEGKVKIGDRVTLKCGVYLWDGTVVEDDVFIGPNAAFTNDIYPRSKQHIEYPVTTLRRGYSIGANATILPGLTVGEYAMVGAGTVVTKDIPAYTLWYGNPGEHRGYICRCAGKLDDPFVCKKCGISYKLMPDGGLKSSNPNR
jgi:acetyltransferase-like isoleucine patch superfamily enzyme